MPPDVIQIVDTYPQETDGHRRTLKNDPDREAEGLSNLAKLLGRHPRKIAIVSRDDEPRLLAYQREDYEIIKINGGNRDTELRRFIFEMTAQIKRDAPKHTVLVSHDPEFVFLCEAAAPHTDLAVWAESGAVPRELAERHYNFRPLEELLPFLKIPRVDVRLDLENILIGLIQRGWVANVPALISAIRQSLNDLGEIVRITAYADWSELARNHGGPNVNWQRDLTLAGGESRYVVNQHGKNTADMLIADDIRSLVELNPSSSGAIDVIVLATMDRDFRPIVETAQRKGKRVVVLGLEQSISQELRAAVKEVRYLDKHLMMQPTGVTSQPDPKHEDVSLMLKVAAWMQQKRWRRAYRDQLDQEFSSLAEPLDKLISDGWLVPTPNSRVDHQGRALSLEVNPDKPSAQAAYYLARWIPERIHYCLKRMAYVDTHYLAIGMNKDRILGQLGIAQSRVAAENWLNAAANAGLVVAREQGHPETPAKRITVWTLPDTNSDAPSEATVATDADKPAVATPATAVDDVAVTAEVTVVNATAETAETGVGANVVHLTTAAPASIPSNHLRHVLTNRLSDSELTTITFDHFRDVHRKFGGAPRVDRIQALLEYVELRNQQQGLIDAIREVNPALVNPPEVQLLAA
jgi:uncharacterized LabA/DUF88 family protein